MEAKQKYYGILQQTTAIWKVKQQAREKWDREQVTLREADYESGAKYVPCLADYESQYKTWGWYWKKSIILTQKTKKNGMLHLMIGRGYIKHCCVHWAISNHSRDTETEHSMV
jgi:hypothetical protein